MEFNEEDKKVLANVHDVFYQAGLIKSPQLAQLGLQFTQLMQRVMGPQKPPMVTNKAKEPEKK
jgi:hypothetical protein